MEYLQRVNEPSQNTAKADKIPRRTEPRKVAYTMQESGNPTPIATCGLFVAFGTLACQLLFARDTITIDSAAVPAHLFFGGFMITLGGALELCLGHYISAMALVALGLFCFPFNKTLLPALSTATQGMVTDDVVPLTMEISTRFEASALILGMILLVYLVSSFRTNVVLVLTIFSLDLGIVLATSAYWLYGGHTAGGSEVGKKMLLEAGVCFIVASACSCWILFSTLLEAVDFPLSLPVGNLGGKKIYLKTNIS
ncbi:hypothetical protein NCS57_00860800 [Fusarium keratoplasticum]|uniref:Uncharacterized protein n=1 Tax=Fusarium keratoplasticum TaxID=1328300 RepID=A0ACC0QT83_9HYPO|nr:hypothetical protein NCS57_00860800 [Fusarium keratoplasticum]KAI8666363.1 hypothetical protein NCS57_00860800 [Fusarium keratoplasticum]KAI8668063.1 hypothetical protein NCS55_00830400 [Fusarium keratoplasticum]